jgi:hypothetical protein
MKKEFRPAFPFKNRFSCRGAGAGQIYHEVNPLYVFIISDNCIATNSVIYGTNRHQNSEIISGCATSFKPIFVCRTSNFFYWIKLPVNLSQLLIFKFGNILSFLAHLIYSLGLAPSKSLSKSPLTYMSLLPSDTFPNILEGGVISLFSRHFTPSDKRSVADLHCKEVGRGKVFHHRGI